MNRTVLVALVIGAFACEETRNVRVILGPKEGGLSIGFRCRDENGVPLAARAGATGHFSLLIDLVTIDGGSPGCRGEDLATACLGTGRCTFVPNRYCVDVDLADLDLDFDDPAKSLEALNRYLREHRPLIRADAPDELVLIRAVTTTAYCADIPPGSLRGQDPSQLMGCAYSCPAHLDDVEDSISLSLDALSDNCEPQVLACAAYPDRQAP